MATKPELGKAARADFRASDFGVSVAIAGLLAIATALCSEAEASQLGSDLAGVVFLLLAIAYRGSARAWWMLLAPTSLFLLFLPVAHWERIGAIDSVGGLLHASLLPGLAFVGGSLIATVRDAYSSAADATTELKELLAAGRTSIIELQTLENDMKDIIEARPVSPSIEPQIPTTGWELVGFKIDEGVLAPRKPSDAMTHFEVERLLRDELDRAARITADRKGVKLMFLSPIEMPIPLAVRGDIDVLRVAVRNLMEIALSSLGGGQGLIRVSLRPNLRTVEIAIEDNGRGLNETLLMKLSEKGLLSDDPERMNLAQVRQLSVANGWTLLMQARLGVGARVTIELPRVDGYATSPRMERSRQQMAFSESAKG